MSQAFVFTEFGGPEHQQLVDRPRPEPGPGEVAIQVKAAGVNPVDWKIREGFLGKHGPLPMGMGREASGVVVAAGAGTDFKVGDEVLGSTAAGHGAFATHTVLDAKLTVTKPEDITFADAATLPVAGATAYDITHQIELEPGQTMVIIGVGGGVGRMAAQIGNVHQFNVLGVASAAKRELVESTGATFIESGDGVADRIRRAAPDGVDLVIDLVGQEVLRAVAPTAKEPARVISAADKTTVLDIGGLVVTRTAESLEKIVGVVEAGLVDPMITARYPLADAASAIAAVEAGHAAGKVIIEP